MPVDRTSKSSFPRQAARASIIAPIVAVVLGYLTRDQAVEDETTARILDVVKWSLIALGFALAIFALARIRRDGTKLILGNALFGLLANGAFIVAIVYSLGQPSRHDSNQPQRYAISTSQWKPFSSQSGRFSVQMPGEPQVKTLEPATGDSTPFVGHQAFVTLPDRSAFSVTWVDPPALESSSPAESEALLDGVVEHRALGKTLLDKHSIELAGHPGREIRLQLSGPHGPVILIERDYVIGHRSYQVLAEMGEGEVEKRGDEIKMFFDSFSASEEVRAK